MAIGKGQGPDWKMFQNNYHRTSGDCYSGGISSVESNVLPQNVAVFPNPSQGIFNITISNQTNENVEIMVFNSLGECALKENQRLSAGTFTRQLQLTHLPNGIYFLELKMGEQTTTEKLIVQ